MSMGGKIGAIYDIASVCILCCSRYEHLAEHERAVVERVLRGHQPLHSIPDTHPRIVRIFISSTFTGKSKAHHCEYTLRGNWLIGR